MGWHLQTASYGIVYLFVLVSLYDCSHYGVCTQCLQGSHIQSNGQTHCVWCQQSGQCSYSTCAGGGGEGNQCPTLDIAENMVQPRYIPVEGGLRLNIPGQGLTVGDGLKTANVTVAGGKLCSNIRDNSEGGQEV